MKDKILLTTLTLGVFLLAAFFRLYGVNWDQNQHLHPDERFLTMVAGTISWPQDLWEYLDASTSPLNPHNRGFGFFVYGTFPIFFTKWIAELLDKADYNQLTIVGRQLSAVFDLGTVILVFLIGKQILKSTNSQINKFSNKNLPKLLEYLILDNWFIGSFAAFIYAAMVLPIQLSHFFAVDTYLTFFLTLSFYILIKLTNCKLIGNWKLEIGNYAILMGIAFGLALASKISAILFLPIIAIGLLFKILKEFHSQPKLTSYQTCYSMLIKWLIYCFIFIIGSYLTFRLSQPYVFATGNIFDVTLNQKVLDNWKQLKSFDDPKGWFPPAVQWIKTRPYVYPFKNMILWGLGLPLGILSILAVISQLSLIVRACLPAGEAGRELLQLNFSTRVYPERKSRDSKNKEINIILFLSLLWILILFLYQGAQFVKAMRYFYPIYPFLAIISSYFIVQVFNKFKIGLYFLVFIGVLVIIYPLSFISIYSQPHSRVVATEWIYKNIPLGSYISSELWDDGLPLNLGGKSSGIYYKNIEFPLYNNDTPEKWKEMDTKLKKVDYIFLTSNRLYGSITTVAEKYPQTNRFYQALFDGSLGFEKVTEFTSRPNLPLPFIKLCLTPPFARYGNIAKKSQECPISGISFVDDYADETFTVYDHPKVIIFKKVKEVDYLKFLYETLDHRPGL